MAHDVIGFRNPDGTNQSVSTVAPLPVTGSVTTTESKASSATTTSVTSVATPVTLKAANAARAGLVVNNDSTSILYILVGTGTVSATNYTYALPPKATVAAAVTLTGYTGIVSGIWASANGFALVTELV